MRGCVVTEGYAASSLSFCRMVNYVNTVCLFGKDNCRSIEYSLQSDCIIQMILLPGIMYLFFSVSLCVVYCVHIFKIKENGHFIECSQKPPIERFYLSNWVISFFQLESFIFPGTPFLARFLVFVTNPFLFVLFLSRFMFLGV